MSAMDDVALQGETAALPAPCSRIPVEHADFVRQIMDRVGDKWTLMVLATLQDGRMRYTELLRAIPGISQRMLSRTLSQLHQDGLITRTAYAEVPPRVEYALAPLSDSLIGIVVSLIDWAITHHDEIRRHRARVETADAR
ncbi:helix-turn-helix domain-containing protein [Streptomyces sp. RKAG293]|uniref:winged helix-turn-helix transcriptional regulator n=1 Tax=Streptomyces sp. RKAG293 TaxID=2893403 RepID=UPI002033BCB6|nr:helix-turn-helix domain-containing protein [Streptomyces sp. RKAG293]MCM2422868.1 helix-turn-helix transcriptional regulator [Streptomyces sp. RKAG293]